MTMKSGTASIQHADGTQTEREMSWEGVPFLGQNVIVGEERFVVRHVTLYHEGDRLDVTLIEEGLSQRRSRFCGTHLSSYEECGCELVLS